LLNINELPKRPIEALEVILTELIRTSRRGGANKIFLLRDQGHELYSEIFILQRQTKAAANFLVDSELKAIILPCVKIGENTTFSQLIVNANRALSAVTTTRFDDHFIDTEDSDQFDTVNLEIGEIEELRSVLNQARSLALSAHSLSPAHKRFVNFWLSVIENQLLKEKIGFANILAGISQIGDLTNKLGNDAEQLAKAIEKIRTKTTKNVEGTLLIDKAGEPKQIEGPASETKDE
jgi:hypothetical protein